MNLESFPHYQFVFHTLAVVVVVVVVVIHKNTRIVQEEKRNLLEKSASCPFWVPEDPKCSFVAYLVMAKAKLKALQLPAKAVRVKRGQARVMTKS